MIFPAHIFPDTPAPFPLPPLRSKIVIFCPSRSDKLRLFGDGENITYAVASEAARFSAAPPPLSLNIYQAAGPGTTSHAHAGRGPEP